MVCGCNAQYCLKSTAHSSFYDNCQECDGCIPKYCLHHFLTIVLKIVQKHVIDAFVLFINTKATATLVSVHFSNLSITHCWKFSQTYPA